MSPRSGAAWLPLLGTRARLLGVWPSRALWMIASCAAISGACAGALTPMRPGLRSQRARTGIAGLASPAATAAAQPASPPQDLYVHCDDRDDCPSAVGMLVVDDQPGQEPERCTVSLIAPDRALTASHCLSPRERHAGAGCARTWVLFPATQDAPAESVACARVLFAAEVVDQSALHQEHAELQLARPVARVPLALSAAPLEPGSIVTVVSVTPHPIYGSTHALTTRLCQTIDPQAAEDALGPAAGNVGWLAGCPIARGNSGSPVLDDQGRIRAIVHGGTSTSSAFAVTSALLSARLGNPGMR